MLRPETIALGLSPDTVDARILSANDQGVQTAYTLDLLGTRIEAGTAPRYAEGQMVPVHLPPIQWMATLLEPSVGRCARHAADPQPFAYPTCARPNAAGERIGICWNSPITSRSASPLMIASALPLIASSRNLSS